jgi:hypothetical protein
MNPGGSIDPPGIFKRSGVIVIGPVVAATMVAAVFFFFGPYPLGKPISNTPAK